MSYIDLIKAFERWLKTNSLPSLSQLLWYKLIYLFNECGWREWITVDNHRLMSELHISNEKTFINSRDKLIEAKLFEYKKGKKGCPNQYKINTVNFTVQNTVKSAVQNIVESTNINRLRQEDKKESKKREKSFDELIENYTQNEELRQALKDHLPIRKRRGSLTNRAIEISFENLNVLTKNITDKELQDIEKIKIVQKSISNGWPDYYPLKKELKKQINYKHEEVITEDLKSLYEN